ncbi:MAG TPA: hypothetical protein VK966_01080 [Longimicrobiales bacterium]|nr:hypothetical protein [Longimicrobiales bacterium]
MYDENGREPGEGWRHTMIKVPGKDGVNDFPALVHDAAPGVGIVVFPWGLFSVTHLRSGMRLNGPYERAANAAIEAAQWAKVLDLEAAASGDDLVKQVEAAPDDPVPFGGATITDNEGSRTMTRREWFESVMADRGWVVEFPWEEQSPWERADEILGLKQPATS